MARSERSFPDHFELRILLAALEGGMVFSLGPLLFQRNCDLRIALTWEQPRVQLRPGLAA